MWTVLFPRNFQSASCVLENVSEHVLHTLPGLLFLIHSKKRKHTKEEHGDTITSHIGRRTKYIINWPRESLKLTSAVDFEPEIANWNIFG